MNSRVDWLPETRDRGVLSLPTVKVAVPMAAGILAVFKFGNTFAIVSAAVLIAAAIYLGIRRSGWILCVLGAVFGIVTAFVWIEAYAAPLVKLAGSTVRADVEIIDVDTSLGYYRYNARGKLDGRTAVLNLTGGGSLHEGQRIIAVIELSEADSSRALYNMRDGVLLDGKIISFATVSANGRKISRTIKNAREMFLEMTSYCQTEDSYALARAMLLGDKSELSAALEDCMCISGVSHYMAVSGTHFAILASVLLEMIPDHRRKARLMASIMITVGGIIFFGATKSVIRASTMFVLSGLAGFFRRKTDTLNSLCVSLILITAFRPANILDVGFEMSVLGVYGVGVVGPRISERLMLFLPENARIPKKVVSALTGSACAVICTSPISVYIFGGVSLCGVIVTLILSPLITVGMTFLLVSGITGIPILMVPADWAMRISVTIVRFFGKARGLYINMDYEFSWVLPTICVVLVSIAAFGGLEWLTSTLKWTALCALISLVLSQLTIFFRFEIGFVGNSESSAAVIMSGRNASIYISGSGTELADDIASTLRKHGISAIECVVAPDAGEAGANEIRELARMIGITEIRVNGEAAERLSGLPVAEDAPDVVSVNGITIGSEQISDVDADTDIVLYRGKSDNPPKTSAGLAVYNLTEKAEIPENGVNIRVDADFKVDLKSFGIKRGA